MTFLLKIEVDLSQLDLITVEKLCREIKQGGGLNVQIDLPISCKLPMKYWGEMTE